MTNTITQRETNYTESFKVTPNGDKKYAVKIEDVVKGETYFYAYNDNWETCLVKGLRKGDNVSIEFTSGSWKGEKKTCKIWMRLFR
tara:strand:- start:41 stop:298 length:258 start_codon:yes stop_codon:yes gene_type:complete